MKNKIKQFGDALHGQVAAVWSIPQDAATRKRKRKRKNIHQL